MKFRTLAAPFLALTGTLTGSSLVTVQASFASLSLAQHGATATLKNPSSTTSTANQYQHQYHRRVHSRSSLALAVATEEPDVTNQSENDQSSAVTKKAETPDFPLLGDDGVYRLENKEQHTALLAANPEKLVVLKVFAPWCRACKGLEPKFLKIVHEPVYKNLPIIFASLSIQHNKAFVQSIGVLALPTIQFYIGQAVQDNFPCGPSKVPILKRKLTQLINEHVDPATRKLKESAMATAKATATEEEQVETPPVETLPEPVPRTFGTPARSEVAANGEASQQPTVSDEHRKRWRQAIPYLADLSLADFDVVLSKVKVLHFEPGSILMREGKMGRTFYILQKGEVEICQKTMSGDPMTTPANYLGTVINRLSPEDYFGERALITGEPRAASIRASVAVTCWTFDKGDFPASSVLSGRTKMVTDDLKELVNDKYGVNVVDLYQNQVTQQILDSSTASQIRGSPNTPEFIRGVDSDEEDEDEEVEDLLGDDDASVDLSLEASSTRSDDAIFSLLSKFKRIQLVSRCFKYIVSTRVRWGDEGIRKRRNMLVTRLTPAQRVEYTDTFKLIDTSGDGFISLLELKRVMNSVGDIKSDKELREVLAKGHDAMDGESILTFQDFMGIMAEAEFYYLFRDIFASLDTNDTGFVKAGELERVLCGVRDLISDDRKSIIDVEDDDMLIDYEQFSRMLLGTALI